MLNKKSNDMIKIITSIIFILSVILFISGITKEVTGEDPRIYNWYKINISIILLIILIVLLSIK
jgi:magnesium-transporting ATPase (P-type)